MAAKAEIVGRVVSDKMDKGVVVAVTRQVRYGTGVATLSLAPGEHVSLSPEDF